MFKRKGPDGDFATCMADMEQTYAARLKLLEQDSVAVNPGEAETRFGNVYFSKYQTHMSALVLNIIGAHCNI